jgi:hypothetical protein
MSHLSRCASLIIAVSLGISACKKNEPPPPPPPPPAAPAQATVTTVSVGKSVGADKRITANADTIGRRDPMYVSVATTGDAQNAVITARWYAPDGVIIRTDSQTLNLAGPAATEFHITRSQPWPVGRYKVDIMLNGRVAGSREWEVR